MSRFKIERPDGRSNAQVVCDTVANAEPGHVFVYEDIESALHHEGRTYDRRAAQAAVRGAIRLLEHTHRRTLQNVPNVGYRVAPASEHMAIAAARGDRATRQIRKGLHTLQCVRYDEMDANTRAAHEGHLMITSALCHQMDALEQRERRRDEAIQSLIRDVAEIKKA